MENKDSLLPKDNKLFSLINGRFSKADAITILDGMVQLKIAFHEAKINAKAHPYEVVFRENRIRQLQNDWAILRKQIMEASEEFLDMEMNLNGALC